MERLQEPEVTSLFDHIAPVYDPMNRVLTLGAYGLWQRALMRRAQLGPGQQVLDVATGTADLAVLAARRVLPGGQVTGVDLSAQMLALGGLKISRLRETLPIHLQIGNALALPLADQTFDRALVGFGLRNMQDLVQALSEMRRVVRPGGLVLSLEMSHPEHWLWASGFHLYFDHLVPWLGALAGHNKAAYEWLPKSLALFPDRATLCALFEEAGLVNVQSWPMGFGAVAIHLGQVPEQGDD